MPKLLYFGEIFEQIPVIKKENVLVEKKIIGKNRRVFPVPETCYVDKKGQKIYVLFEKDIQNIPITPEELARVLEFEIFDNLVLSFKSSPKSLILFFVSFGLVLGLLIGFVLFTQNILIP